MSKKDEAFELFAQGKCPGDSEVEALGLKSLTEKKYFSEWRRLQTDESAEVGSLEPGQSFILNNEPYIVSAVYPFGVMAVPPEPTPGRKLVEELSPDTLVKPI